MSHGDVNHNYPTESKSSTESVSLSKSIGASLRTLVDDDFIIESNVEVASSLMDNRLATNTVVTSIASTSELTPKVRPISWEHTSSLKATTNTMNSQTHSHMPYWFHRGEKMKRSTNSIVRDTSTDDAASTTVDQTYTQLTNLQPQPSPRVEVGNLRAHALKYGVNSIIAPAFRHDVNSNIPHYRNVSVVKTDSSISSTQTHKQEYANAPVFRTLLSSTSPVLDQNSTNSSNPHPTNYDVSTTLTPTITNEGKSSKLPMYVVKTIVPPTPKDRFQEWRDAPYHSTHIQVSVLVKDMSSTVFYADPSTYLTSRIFTVINNFGTKSEKFYAGYF